MKLGNVYHWNMCNNINQTTRKSLVEINRLFAYFKYKQILVSFILFLFTATMPISFAATNTFTPKKLSIQVSLNYQERNRDGSINQHSIKNTLKTSINNHKWTAIENKSYNKSSQFVVLTKIEKANAKEVTMKFLVLNTDIKPSIISAPKMTMSYGQKAQINIEEKNQKIQLIVITTAK